MKLKTFRTKRVFSGKFVDETINFLKSQRDHVSRKILEGEAV